MRTYGLVQRVSVELVFDEPLELPAQLVHKVRTRRDLVRVEHLGDTLALLLQVFAQIRRVLGAAEATRPLLVHFCARSDAVDGKQDQFSRFDCMHDLVDGPHDVRPDLLEVVQRRNLLVLRLVIAVDAIVYDAVDVKVQVVFGNRSRDYSLTYWRHVLLVLDALEDQRVPPREPLEELGNAHAVLGCW